MNVSDSFKDPELCKGLLERLHNELDQPLRFMEVCGTHTVAIFQSGLRPVLPENITHLSGPGCPVCVTHESEVAAFLDIAGRDGVIVATFGDLMRVPGPKGRNLKMAQAEGARIEIVYSPMDAITLAQNNPTDTVVFLGVGFETTAPTIAATIMMAKQQGVTNFKVLSFHKLVPPALKVLLDDPDCAIDSFLLPGHVSTILGMEPYQFVAQKYKTPGVITGFEPVDILESLLIMVEQRKSGDFGIVNQYKRAVGDTGNARAREVLFSVFQTSDALWRGVGSIPESGLIFRDEFSEFDAQKVLDIPVVEMPPTPGCKCGEVLKGKMQPPDCPLFGKGCTPAKPVGPCMVSTEGSCAAYYKYSV